MILMVPELLGSLNPLLRHELSGSATGLQVLAVALAVPALLAIAGLWRGRSWCSAQPSRPAQTSVTTSARCSPLFLCSAECRQKHAAENASNPVQADQHILRHGCRASSLDGRTIRRLLAGGAAGPPENLVLHGAL